ncbi:MAG: DUF2800 domain-containing protein, partial [Ruminiclostridium sp.]
PDELGDLYTKVYAVNAWMNKIKETVEYQVNKGVKIKGWKKVAGKSKRVIIDPDGLEKALAEKGLDPAMTHTPSQLLALTHLEKLFGGTKKFTEACGAYIGKTTEKPAIVPDSDPREEINTAASDFKDVAAPAPAPTTEEEPKAKKAPKKLTKKAAPANEEPKTT